MRWSNTLPLNSDLQIPRVLSWGRRGQVTPAQSTCPVTYASTLWHDLNRFLHNGIHFLTTCILWQTFVPRWNFSHYCVYFWDCGGVYQPTGTVRTWLLTAVIALRRDPKNWAGKTYASKLCAMTRTCLMLYSPVFFLILQFPCKYDRFEWVWNNNLHMKLSSSGGCVSASLQLAGDEIIEMSPNGLVVPRTPIIKS